MQTLLGIDVGTTGVKAALFWTDMSAYELLAQEAESIAPGSDGLLFLLS